MDRDRHELGRLLFTWLVDSIALGVAVWLVGGVRSSSYLAIAVAGLVFGLALINMLIVWLTAAIVPGFDAEGFWPIAKAAIVIWLVNVLLGGFWPERDKKSTVSFYGSY